MTLKPTQFFSFSTPVILGLVPRIFWQQTPNQVNKLAFLNVILADYSQQGVVGENNGKSKDAKLAEFYKKK